MNHTQRIIAALFAIFFLCMATGVFYMENGSYGWATVFFITMFVVAALLLLIDTLLDRDQ